MTLQERIKSESIAARKAAIGKSEGPEYVKSQALTMLVSALNTAMKEKNVEALQDPEVIDVVTKSVKTVDDAFNKGAAGAYAEKLTLEREILSAYVPAQLEESVIQQRVDAYVESKGAPLEVKDTGPIMNALKAEFPGQINGATVSKVIKTTIESQ